ncbi:helix-turn-helix transcriptional regulator [Corynebacterium sp. AOP36-E1-14]|uniref:helix-turn-helix transcriptional regulator n=1 Tax=unclassified Corynebacterium TaxID=2624378 RepID=UPI003FB6E05B
MSERDTRREVLAQILRNGPVSATDISDALGLSAAGVRRHLDNIVSDGLAETVEAPRSANGRTRGRPARQYRLTDAGRGRFGHDYDTLALLALRALRETGGDDAVAAFADQRMQELFGSVEDDESGDAPGAVVDRAGRIAEALTDRGYAATVNEAATGVQICRHHCPVQDVAHEFPELCAAEHRVVTELLGHHTQPLATIADGNGICTTHIPLTTIHPSSTKES